MILEQHDRERPDDRWTDEQWLVAYVAGELSATDEVRFEARLAAEPTLARRLEQHERTELLGTLAARARPVAAPSGSSAARIWSGPRAGLMLLLAAACLVAGALWWGHADADAFACDVRAVATVEPRDAMAYAASIGLTNVVVEGSESRGAGTTARVLPAPAFLEQLTAAEAQRDPSRFAAPQEPIDGGFVTLRFSAAVECSAVVILQRDGRLQRVYPGTDGAFVFGMAQNRFGPGSVHVLPRPVLVANAIGGLNQHPGFDLGPADAGSRTLVLALRAEAVDGDLLTALDARLAGGDLPALRVWLTQQGFVVRQTVVGAG